jgi:hypothetical protein
MKAEGRKTSSCGRGKKSKGVEMKLTSSQDLGTWFNLLKIQAPRLACDGALKLGSVIVLHRRLLRAIRRDLLFWCIYQNKVDLR